MNSCLAVVAATVAAGPVLLVSPAFAQDAGNPNNTVQTTSYECVSFGVSTAQAQGASLGASYGRVETVGALLLLENTPSLDSGAYLALGAWLPNDSGSAGIFSLDSLSPNAGFSHTDVLVPAIGMTGPITVRFDGILASPQAYPNPEIVKVSAPMHATGPVDVTVESPSKTVTYESGFGYIPALDAPAEITIGGHVQMRVLGNPGAQFWLAYAASLAAPTAFYGIDGTLDLDPTTLTSLGAVAIPASLPGGAVTREGYLEFTMPDDPALAGKTYFVQGATADLSLPGAQLAFTNHVAVTVKN